VGAREQWCHCEDEEQNDPARPPHHQNVRCGGRPGKLL
jgi:hypothetical protein